MFLRLKNQIYYYFRTIILYKKPSNFSKPIAKLEKGRLLVLKKCKNIWCNVMTDEVFGLGQNSILFGVLLNKIST